MFTIKQENIKHDANLLPQDGRAGDGPLSHYGQQLATSAAASLQTELRARVC